MKSCFNVITVVIAFFMGTLFPIRSAAQNMVEISTGEWAPFLSEHLEHGGIATQIVTAAFAAVGIDVLYRWYGDAWERAKLDAEHGKVDFSAVWYHTEERARIFKYSEPVIDVATVFFFHKDVPFFWRSYDTIDPRNVIGVTRGYSYSAEFDSAKESGAFRYEIADRDILGFRKLLRKRIDAFVIGELVGQNLLRRNFSPTEVASLAVHPLKISKAPLFLIMSRTNSRAPSLLVRFNEGMQKLRNSGEHEEILRQYR